MVEADGTRSSGIPCPWLGDPSGAVNALRAFTASQLSFLFDLLSDLDLVKSVWYHSTATNGKRLERAWRRCFLAFLSLKTDQVYIEHRA